MLFIIATDIFLGSASYVGIVVTGLLFAISQFIMVLKWGHSLDKSTAVLAEKISVLSDSLEEVEKALKTLSDVHVRFDAIEVSRRERKTFVNDKLGDHEVRIRRLEVPIYPTVGVR